jgi:transcriptional regulator GlxA family with amidase domain
LETIMQPIIAWTDSTADDCSLCEPRAAVSPAIGHVLDFIEQNYAESIALSDLAVMCGLSLHRFVTVFREQVGIPPHQYVCRTRVRQARMLLRQGLPLAAVAFDTGFCDQSHLSRHFKRHCGITPGHFAGTRAMRTNAAA